MLTILNAVLINSELEPATPASAAAPLVVSIGGLLHRSTLQIAAHIEVGHIVERVVDALDIQR